LDKLILFLHLYATAIIRRGKAMLPIIKFKRIHHSNLFGSISEELTPGLQIESGRALSFKRGEKAWEIRLTPGLYPVLQTFRPCRDFKQRRGDAPSHNQNVRLTFKVNLTK